MAPGECTGNVSEALSPFFLQMSRVQSHCSAGSTMMRVDETLGDIQYSYQSTKRSTNESLGKLSMRHLMANGLVFISSAILCSGCTSYSSQPTIKEHVNLEEKENISNFSYEINSPWNGSRFGKDAYAATRVAIPNAQDISTQLAASTLPALEIKISEFSSGGACTQDYLTGLSLGLIPSWCTRPNLFKFHFVLNKDQSLCRQQIYSISSTSFSHLLMIPFALFNANNQPLTLYQAALKNFLQTGPCTTHV